ncbi:hypothetical protein Psch_00586 [Pelotomaculum schinkii]|uniref:Putative Se/S carrier protein-like domain-containing protein n=1 Tax=Pelotomaculum schinkii TaxID=78350 RepID=A0A4Y7RDF0_9FIRM|nr:MULTISPECIES: putative Se/S carrier-like protein [Pelotomaculum]TEB07045.1 hypothetical protein Psch_00586 [Pelotomaculum schinkii]TEB16960.1 hypothetical protein Psfp_00896 [Pelotomaculum sp. FP]
MIYALAVFPSVSQVNQMKNRLNKNSEYYGMVRAPHCIAAGGCNFALRFDEDKLSIVKHAAQELGVAIQGIYREEKQDDGDKVYTKIE